MRVGKLVSPEWLKKTELFGDLDEQRLTLLSSQSVVKSYPAGQTIFLQGEEATHLFILITGGIDLRVKTRESIDFMASKIEKEGAVFGTASLMEPFHYNVSAICFEPSEVLMIDARWLKERMKEDPKMGLEIMKRLATIYFNRLNELRSGVSDLIKMFGKKIP